MLSEEKEIFFFNDTLNTFYLWLYGIRYMVKDNSDSERGNCRRHMGYSFRLVARVLLYASSHRQGNTYHNLCYTSHGALARKTKCYEKKKKNVTGKNPRCNVRKKRRKISKNKETEVKRSKKK